MDVHLKLGRCLCLGTPISHPGPFAGDRLVKRNVQNLNIWISHSFTSRSDKRTGLGGSTRIHGSGEHRAQGLTPWPLLLAKAGTCSVWCPLAASLVPRTIPCISPEVWFPRHSEHGGAWVLDVAVLPSNCRPWVLKNHRPFGTLDSLFPCVLGKLSPNSFTAH